jgi:hypothetical protein
MRHGLTAIVVVAAFAAVTTHAEIRRATVGTSARTNATWAAIGESSDAGLLRRVTVSIGAGTQTMAIADSDGSAILSNAFTGTTTTNFSTSIPFVGLNITGASASTNGATGLITLTIER